MKRGSLRLRLLLAAAASIGVALLLAAAGLAALFQHHVERRVEAELAAHLEQLVASVERNAQGELSLPRQLADPRFNAALSGLYWQIQSGGSVLRSRSLWDERLALPADMLADGDVHRHRIPGPGGTELLALERSVIPPARIAGASLQASVAIDAAEIRAARREFLGDLLPYLALIAALLFLAAWIQVQIGLSPLATVRARLAAIHAGAAHRLGERFPDEILPLARQVDVLLAQQERELERARHRAADLAHGLKTPLQVLAGDVEALRARGEHELAGEIEEVATLMRRHVDRELARARMAADRGEACAAAADVIGRVVAVIGRTPAGARLKWLVDVPGDLQLRIDPDDLAEALGNLIENAARHAESSVIIRTTRQDDDARLEVIDDGPGIPAERLEEVLARGGRLDTSGSGAGLGLAIARDIAEAWDGRLEIRSPAAGLEAVLVLRPATKGPKSAGLRC
jgi:signal transduction histidine kinase